MRGLPIKASARRPGDTSEGPAGGQPRGTATGDSHAGHRGPFPSVTMGGDNSAALTACFRKLPFCLGGDVITSDGEAILPFISFHFNSPAFLVTKGIENSLLYLENSFCPITPLKPSLTLVLRHFRAHHGALPNRNSALPATWVILNFLLTAHKKVKRIN